MRPTDENQHGSTRPNLLSGGRRRFSEDDNLFATAAFAQTPAAPAASAPAKVEAAHAKAVVKADAPVALTKEH